MNNINVVYTSWSNLKKTGDMDVGQIGFFRHKDVSLFSVASLNTECIVHGLYTNINRLIKLLVLAPFKEYCLVSVSIILLEFLTILFCYHFNSSCTGNLL